jgi:hypothetical protein
MKDIKAAVVYFIATDELPSEIWVRKSSANKFAGVWGWLQSHASQSRKGKRRVLQLLNLYTSVVAKQLSRKQKKKFFSSVEGKRNKVPSSYHQNLARAARDFHVAELKSLDDFLSSAKRRPNHESRMLPEFYEFFGTPTGRKLIVRHFDILNQVLGPLLGTQRPRSEDAKNPAVIGEIHCTQEPGFKARLFASPQLWLQQCLEPLKRGLNVLLQNLPWDGTHNQQIADEHILHALSVKRNVHCFDLSDATNVFPLELQITVLRTVLHKKDLRYVEFFNDVATLPWKFEDRTVVWARGQALGLGPSFSMFALTHGMLIYALNGKNHNNDFFVIGDDVVILNDQLAESYANALVELDLPYSPLKTLRSNRIAEFAGYTFTPEGKFQTMKWKGLRDENLLETVRNNGPEFIEFVPAAVRPFVEWFTKLPEPIGFGWNREGSKITERIPIGLAGFSTIGLTLRLLNFSNRSITSIESTSHKKPIQKPAITSVV